MFQRAMGFKMTFDNLPTPTALLIHHEVLIETYLNGHSSPNAARSQSLAHVCSKYQKSRPWDVAKSSKINVFLSMHQIYLKTGGRLL